MKDVRPDAFHLSHAIERLTGRKVIGFMSVNHLDPDLAVEVFVLKPLPPRVSLAARPAPWLLRTAYEWRRR